MTSSPVTADRAAVHVVVGGASGIGAAVVDRERAAGAEVVVWDVAGACDIRCDVTDPVSVDDAVHRTLADAGALTDDLRRPPREFSGIGQGFGHRRGA